MKVYGVITITNDTKYAKFQTNLNIFHGRAFPMLKKDQVYKVLNRDLCIVQVGNRWSTGDLLDNLTVGIELSDKDRFYCLPISNDAPIRLNHNYLHAVDDFKSNESHKTLDNIKQTAGIFYLANYLYMLEKDRHEHGSISAGNDVYVISDKFQTWTTNEKYKLKVDISSRRSGRGKFVEENVTFKRFDYHEIEEWIRFSANVLGFNMLFYRNGEIVNDVNENNFIETELLFSGHPDWKEKLNFNVDGTVGARTVSLNNKEGEWEKITRKPYDLVLPKGVWFDRHYDKMMADVAGILCSHFV